MPLDPSIALQVQRPRMPSYGERMTQMMTVRDLMDQRRIRQSQMQQMEQQEADRLAIRDLAKASGGDINKFMDGYREIDPVAAMQFQSGQQKTQAQTEKAQLELSLQKVNTLGQIIGAARDPASYQQARVMAINLLGPESVQMIPEQYDPSIVEQAMAQTLTAKDQIETALQQAQFSETQRHNRATEGNQPLVEIHDPASPTGSRMVTRQDAMGKPGKAPASLSARFDPESGEFEISQGGPLTKSTQTEAEKKVLKSGDIMSQLNVIKSKFKPEYHTLGGKLWGGMKGAQAYINPESLSPDDKKQYTEYRSYLQDIGRMQAAQINELYGAALSGGESKRAEKFVVNDNDDPITAKEKLKGYEDLTRKALMKYAYVQRHGLNINDVDLDKMPLEMNARGAALEQELRAQGVAEDQIIPAVKMKLADEFGLVAY